MDDSHQAPPNPAIDEEKLDSFIRELTRQQNLPMAVAAGFVAALLGAAIWGAITVATGWQIGWMAIGVGFLVGFSVRSIGKGIHPSFGIVGAIFALFGCILGNLISVLKFYSQQAGVSLGEVVANLDIHAIPDLLATTFAPIDLLFYAVATYQGYRFSIREITEAEIKKLSA